ncbi:hypothetical protein [Conexibacter sp. SYSU D00693]|uniref:hypothetical protein n=1 Tax=Conexibacter sp. SYSU D00693 TaxID=2812560 RepID=UPI00196B7E55|nr:hypothetical protein [Conexibacter sp. SYSU D00693]
MIDPTTTMQEQELLAADLAHEHGVVLDHQGRAEPAAREEGDDDTVVYPYAYALESLVT